MNDVVSHVSVNDPLSLPLGRSMVFWSTVLPLTSRVTVRVRPRVPLFFTSALTLTDLPIVVEFAAVTTES